MQIVIDIPKEVKNRLCFGVTYPKDIQVVCEALDNGTPLPKGHGRLIDADALIHWHRFESKSDYDIANAPTIIEADKAERGIGNETDSQ